MDEKGGINMKDFLKRMKKNFFLTAICPIIFTNVCAVLFGQINWSFFIGSCIGSLTGTIISVAVGYYIEKRKN